MADKTYADLTAATDVQDADLLATWRPSGPGPLKKIQASLVKAYMLLGLGTASTKDTGTSGATVPLLNGANTWGAKQTFADVEIDGAVTFGGSDTGPGEVLVNSGTVSGAATLDITLSGGYAAYRIVLTACEPATDNTTLRSRISIDNGASYKAGSTDYSHTGLYSVTSGTSGHFEAAAESAMVLQPVGSSNTTGLTPSYEMRLFTPNGANTVAMWKACVADSMGNLYSIDGAGRSNWSLATDIRFLFSSGNIANAAWALYGLRGLP